MVKKVKGGDVIDILLTLFFISFIFNLFICFYSIYSFINIKCFHNLQGSKLNIKKNSLF